MKNIIFILSIILITSCSKSINEEFSIETPSKQITLPLGNAKISNSYLLNSGVLFCPSLQLVASQDDEPLSVAIKWELYDDKGRLFASLLSDTYQAQKGLFQSGKKTFEVRKRVPESFLTEVKAIEVKVIAARFGRGDLFGGG